jgi:hypothetical protein
MLVFLLAATSIGCLLADFYGLASMRAFTFGVGLPGFLGLAALTAFDAWRGDGRLARAVLIGSAAGLVAAAAYDLFRLPFVFSKEWGLDGVVPPMPLFKVFPRFGAMILGQTREQATYSAAAHLLGWAYHFSNGLTFGVMLLALIGEAAGRSWGWAVLLALALELGMILSPYPSAFSIPLTTRFVVVTLAAHAVFGVVLGLFARFLANRWPDRPAAT